MKFDELYRAWALHKLTELGVKDVQEVDYVDFELDHNCCSCDEYCYHDNGVDIEVWVRYRIPGPRGGLSNWQMKQVCSTSVYDLASLIREIVEYV